MICVIGSGPSGITAAYSLVKAGHTVLLLDVGITLEPEIHSVVARMAATDADHWDKNDRIRLCSRMQATPKGVALKYIFGSDFPYRDAAAEIKLVRTHADLLPSFARGGLSNAWGAALLPVCAADIQEWPVSASDLEPHYRALHQFMPLSGGMDELADSFPLCGTPEELPASRQALQLLQQLRRKPVSGVRFGRSRLAVGMQCRACGLCLYGCPYGLIYNSSDTLAYLRTLSGFSYRPATVVRRLDEKQGVVIITAATENGIEQIRADAVFLAAGTLPSTRIILESLEAYDHPVPLKDSQYFLFPLLMARRSRGATTEKLHTLSQLFLELNDKNLGTNSIHLQCYTYNDLFKGALDKFLGPLSSIFPRNVILERLLLIQGYLHSDLTSPMQLTLHRDRLELAGEANRHVAAIVSGIMKKLGSLGWAFAANIGASGRGFHSGASLPMRTSPAPFESDIWGRPYGFERVHLVDASILPSIPATPITYTVMANAHRIASEYSTTPKTVHRAPCCAVTGANGYVGKALCAYLRKQGFEVIPLVRRPTGAERRFSLEDTPAPGLLDGVDFLIHAAYDFSATTVEQLQEINIAGSERLFAAAEKARIKRTILISSFSAYTGCASNYGRTKMAIEALARRYGIVVVRPGLVFGAQSGGMAGALQRLSRLKVIPLVGTGNQLLYLSHQEDLGKLLQKIMLTPDYAATTPIMAAHRTPLTLKNILRCFSDAPQWYLPLPAKVLLLLLRTIEALGFSSRLRSDSLVSLLTPSPPPDFTALDKSGVIFRPFTPGQP